MALLGFILECSAIAVLVGTVASLLSSAVCLALRPSMSRWSPGMRSDALFLAGVLPALVAIGAALAAAAPSIGMALGFGADHCVGHADHFHICFVHAGTLKPTLATIGAFGLAVWAYRAVSLVRGLIATEVGARALERLGRVQPGRFPVYVLPAAKLCHATGLLRRRIMLSSDLAEQLSPEELRSVLAHEDAHLSRRDPLASLMLAVAGLVVPPPFVASLRRAYRQATEEACDASAAAQVGDAAAVAATLVKVAGLQRGTAAAGVVAAPFGGDGLEARVRALLEDPNPTAARSRGPALALVAAGGFALAALSRAEWLHHATETLLGRLF